MDKINGLRYAFRIAIVTLLMFLTLGASAALKEVQLTTDTSNDSQAVISPDGKKIAFVSDRSGTDEIWVMNEDGSGQTKLTNLGKAYRPVWSPNGNEIAFHRDFPDAFSADVWKVSADGSVVTQLTNSPGHQADPKFSPDGTKITYESGSGGWAHVWIMNSDGTSQTPLAIDHPMDLQGSWSPDGNKISYIYCSNYYLPASLAIMNPDGSGKTTIVSTPNADWRYYSYQAWSPDSSKIVFALSSNEIWENRRVYIINTDGSGYAKIANGDIAGQKQYGVWSPDGSKIVYFSNDSGNIDVWIMNPDGTSKEQLTTNSGEDSYPIFSPDGNRFIFQTNRNGNWDIYAIELPSVRFINGTVMDSITKEVLPGVKVSTTEASTTSSVSGFYSLPVASGTYPITAIYDIRYYTNSSVTVSTEFSAVVVQDIELVKKPMGNITGNVTKA